jgi:hypothetical protein
VQRDDFGCGVVSIWLAALGIEARPLRAVISAAPVATKQDWSAGVVLMYWTAA